LSISSAESSGLIVTRANSAAFVLNCAVAAAISSGLNGAGNFHGRGNFVGDREFAHAEVSLIEVAILPPVAATAFFFRVGS